MVDKKRLEKILNELKEKIGLEEKIQIRFKKFKRKIASISLTKKVIYLNSLFLNLLSEEEVKYLIAHELLHLKYGIIHTPKFEKELIGLCGKDLSERILMKVWRELMKKQI